MVSGWGWRTGALLIAWSFGVLWGYAVATVFLCR
jgi:hypothetical protein